MQKNKAKTQSLQQRYKVDVWPSEQGKGLISVNKVHDEDKLSWAKRHPDV